MGCDVVVFQHGDNPEAVLEFDRLQLNVSCYLTLVEWTDRIHEYEAAARSTPDGGSDGEG